MRQRWRMCAWCSIAWLVLANGLPAHAGWPGGSQHHDDKKDDNKADQGAKKVDQEMAANCIKERAWLAYLKGPDGALSPARNTLNLDHDEDWLGLHFTDYEGPRIRLGVLSVVNKAAEPENSDGKERLAVPAAGIQEMLTAALYNTKRFDVIEQQRVEEIKRQQMRTDTVAFPVPPPDPSLSRNEGIRHQPTRRDVAAPHSPPSDQTIGRVLGVQYLVYGTVNEWTPDRTSSSTGGHGLLSHIPGASALGQPNVGKKTAEVAITFTLADVASGQVLFTTALRAKIGDSHFDLGGGEGGSESSGRMPVNYAVAACTNKAAFEIARYLQSRKWKGSIVEIVRPDIYVNTGSQGGMSRDAILRVNSVIRQVVDPETHTILGEDTLGIGSIKIYKVEPNFSVGRVSEQATGIKVGDRVELDQPKEPAPPRQECVEAEASPVQ